MDAGDDVSMDSERDAVLGFGELMMDQCQSGLAEALLDDEQLEDSLPV